MKVIGACTFATVPALKRQRLKPLTAALSRIALPVLREMVTFVTAPRIEPYGQVAVFVDLEGNRWDLLSHTEAG